MTRRLADTPRCVRVCSIDCGMSKTCFFEVFFVERVDESAGAGEVLRSGRLAQNDAEDEHRWEPTRSA